MQKNYKFQLRGVQLDLARQMESLDFILEFIDFIENAGYNTLVLYLEGRIKTSSFPYPEKGEYYTIEEMVHVVEYASGKNIDVIPVVSVLGHAEHFLKHRELEHLSEIRGDAKSPLEEHINHVFCPSLAETFDFIKKYLTEIAEIFPSKYLHLGCDEVWDLGCCNICRNRIHSGETYDDIFGKYLIKIHSFVTKELNRKMMIWDDLFECYPHALEMLPRDIILCCWQYDRCIDIPKAHFKSRLEEDLLMKYEKMGFDYIFAPATYYVGNIESLTCYAGKHSPLGGLLTVWEKSLNFMHEIMPLIHYTGSLWSGKDIGFNESMYEIFGYDDPLFLNALRSYYEIKLTHPTRLVPESYLCGQLTEFEAVLKSSCATNAAIFESCIDKFEDIASKNIIEDMLISLKWKAIMFKLRAVLEELYSFGADCPNSLRRKEITTEAVGMIDDFIKTKLDQWKRFRQGISSAKTEKRFHDFREKVLKFAESSAKVSGVLKAKFFLPDMYNAQKCSFSVQFEDGSSEKIANGIYKNYEHNDAYFILKFPYYTNEKPISIRLDSWLYGGQGIAYLELNSKNRSFKPASIGEVKGNVQSAHHILFNDLRWCYMGESDMKTLFEMPQLAQRKHGMTILLK
jgi:hypothetical protein